MKIGIMSAAFPELGFGEVLTFLEENHFGSVEAACWPAGEGKDRKYGGVVHINVDDLPPSKVDEIQGECDEGGITLSALGYYANPLHDDPEHREKVIAHLKKVILGAEKLGVEVVGTFTGRPAKLAGRCWEETIDLHFGEYEKVWPDLIKFAGDHDVKIAIEHCPMLWHDTWPGGNNLSYSPAILRRSFEIIPDENYGIMYDPSHFIWQQIDYIRFIYDFGSRIFSVHAQDMDLDQEMCYQHGILSAGIGIQKRRIPGMGLVDWQEVIKALYNVGYNEVLNIEHEDPNWEGSLKQVKDGFRIGRRHLETFTVN
jgi:sugar phosphate isomerase/epimerase